MSYDTTFYDVIRAGSQSSAQVIVPLLNRLFNPGSVVDVGCGEGWFASVFAELGASAFGIDGDYVSGHTAPGVLFIPADLATTRLRDLDIGTFDLAISLEVAEHLPPECAEAFVDDLCSLAPVVAFSAAIPGQGGTGHLNEQWPAYWTSIFQECGYRICEDLRWQLWHDERVECWYRQNLLIAVRHDYAVHPSIRFVDHTPLAVVHPILYDARRGA